MSGKQPKIDLFVNKKRKIDEIDEGESSDVSAGELPTSDPEENTQKSSGIVQQAKSKQANRKFHDEWETDFFVTEYKSNAICLLCRHEFTQFKKYGIERHFKTNHIAANEKWPLSSTKRTDEILRLKKELTSEQKVFKRFTSTNELILRASYDISFEIARRGKPYVDGEFHKELMQSTVQTLCENWDDATKTTLLDNIKKMPLSHQTVSRRVNEIGADLEANLKKELEECESFSIALDETTDIKGEAQLMFWVRYVIGDRIEENILALISLPEHTTADELFRAFLATCKRFNLDLKKMVSICSDGAPAMVGIRKGFVALVKNHVAQQFDNHHLISYHCIIHQENLSAKALQKSCNVVEIVSKVCIHRRTYFSYVYIILLLFTDNVLLSIKDHQQNSR